MVETISKRLVKIYSKPKRNCTLKIKVRGAWMAQLVKRLTLGFSLGHDLTVCEFKSCVGLHWDSLSHSAPSTFSLSHMFSLSQNK